MDTQQGSTSNNRATGVGDLPVGLLGRALIQHLPWDKRVQVEEVCRRWQREALAYGWEDVKYLEWGKESGGVPLQSTFWMPLLSRIGPHLTALNILGDRLDGDQLLAGLAECPKLRHLRVWWRLLTPPVLDHIAPTLKSLRLNADELYDSERASALSEAICHLPALEYLRVGYWSEIEFCIPLVSLGNLRHLTINMCNISQDSFERLAALPFLRSLTLWKAWKRERIVKRRDFSALQRFPRLEHLYIDISDSNVESFVEVLPHLGASLKALQVGKWLKMAEVKQLLLAITAHLHQLEHLELLMMVWEKNRWEEVEQTLPYSQLKSLRSLCISTQPPGWGWLERICLGHHQRLEYLELDEVPPLATLCKIVRECKSLNGIKFFTRYQWNDSEMETIAEAAAAAAIGGKNGTEEKGENCTLPTLYIATDLEKPDKFWIQKAQIYNSSRLRFVDEDELQSHVLDKHRYGCLSEKRPPLISI